MPVAHWLTGGLRDLTQDMLSKDTIERQNLFNYPYIQELISAHLGRQKDNRKVLWNLAGFSIMVPVIHWE